MQALRLFAGGRRRRCSLAEPGQHPVAAAGGAAPVAIECIGAPPFPGRAATAGGGDGRRGEDRGVGEQPAPLGGLLGHPVGFLEQDYGATVKLSHEGPALAHRHRGGVVPSG